MAPQTTLAAVSQTGESMSFFDIATGEKTGHLSNLIPEPHELCLDRKRNVLYLTHAYAHGWYGAHGDDGHQISVIDCASRQVVDVIDISPARGPHYALVDHATDTLYACVEGGLNGDTPNAGGIVAVDLGTRQVTKSVPSGYKTHWFVATPDFRKAYCSNKDAGFISVLDLTASTLLKTLPAPDGNEQPCLSRDGRHAYFPTPTILTGQQQGPSATFGILVISTQTDEIVHRIPTDAQPLGTHVTATDLLLVGQAPPPPVPSTLLVLAGHDGGYERLACVPVGQGPLTVTSDAEGKTAFVAGVVPGTVTVVDLEALRVVRTIVVDGCKREGKGLHVGAHGMAVF